MKKKVSVLITGAGGYGNNYLKAIFDNYDSGIVDLKGIVDPDLSSCRFMDQIKGNRIPVYDNMEEFYKNSKADLCVISSPIQFHAEQTIFALNNGSHVLCEKPLCAVIGDGEKIKALSKKTGRFVSVGYQLSHDGGMLQFKKDILKGDFGKPIRLKTLALLPRTENYYKRNSWAGKIKDDQGRWVLDSVANNAAAHELHNMFFVLGDDSDKSAYPVRVTAELYRANEIESFDTCAIRAITQNDTEILFYATHGVKDPMGPIFTYEFERATAYYDKRSASGEGITVYFKDGGRKTYRLGRTPDDRKFYAALETILTGEDRITCKEHTAMAHTICINASHKSFPSIVEYDYRIIWKTNLKDDEITWVEGLGDVLFGCYDKGKLPHEERISWAMRPQTINTVNYMEITL